MSIIKGQNLRLMVQKDSAYVAIAASTSCTVHLSTSLEESSTKDDTNDWQSQECVGKSWEMSADALYIVDSAETAEVVGDMLSLVGTEVEVEFVQTSGDKNRTAGAVIVSGKAIVNDLSITAGNRANATYSVQLTGNGELTIGA